MLDLAADASIEWREMIVVARAGAARVTLRWDVVRAGRPVLRQSVAIAPDVPRVLASAFVSGPDVSATTRVHGPAAVAARLDAHTELITVLADDAASASHALAGLLPRFVRAEVPLGVS